MKSPLLFALFMMLVFSACPWMLSDSVRAQNIIKEPDPFIIIENQGNAVEAAKPEEGGKPTASGEAVPPSPLSAQISQHIIKLAEAERDKRMEFMNVVIDDIVRLCKLDPRQREQLELAAMGASERSMKEWHEQAERYFRTRLENTEGDAAKEMLEGMGSVNFGGNRSEEEGESLDLWNATVKDVLTEEQVRRYESILEERHLSRVAAFADMSISTIDDHLRLTPDQRTKMEELVHASAVEYLVEVQRYWGDYFERRMLMSLANAAEEDVLKSILTEEQFDRLREATSDFDHFWDQKRRLKRAKEKAAERRRTSEEEEAYKENEGESDNP